MLKIDIVGSKEFDDSLGYVRRGLVDFRQLGTWRAVAAAFYRVVERIFESEGSGKWQALTPKYAAVKREKYGDQPILTASGSMRRSLTQFGAANAVYEESSQTLTLGTNDPKADWHHSGKGRNPKRPIYEFNGAQQEEIIAPVHQKLKQLIANAKLREVRGL